MPSRSPSCLPDDLILLVMSFALPEILYEDNHCPAAAKPAGGLSTHYAGKEETVDRAVKRYLKEKYKTRGNVFLGIVHRLSRVGAAGFLCARTGRAAARLAAQPRHGAHH